MTERHAGVIGATGLVGECLLPELVRTGWRVTAFSRQPVNDAAHGVEWRRIQELFPRPIPPEQKSAGIPCWVSIVPIWVLPDCFEALQLHGIRRLVALSSTSRFTKGDSSNSDERELALRLIEAEARLQAWAELAGVEWVILRPTMIYGWGLDRNVSEIGRFINRYGFFPLLGRASGLRQPVHVEDVAHACLAALDAPRVRNRAYNISGGETLTYKEMVCRVFAALRRKPCLPAVPLSVFRLAITCIRYLSRYRQWSVAMAQRMNRNLVFDYTDAARDLGFRPREFRLTDRDIHG